MNKKKKEGMNTIKKDNKFQPREMNTSNKKALSNMKKIKNSGRRPELRKKKCWFSLVPPKIF